MGFQNSPGWNIWRTVPFKLFSYRTHPAGGEITPTVGQLARFSDVAHSSCVFVRVPEEHECRGFTATAGHTFDFKPPILDGEHQKFGTRACSYSKVG